MPFSKNNKTQTNKPTNPKTRSVWLRPKEEGPTAQKAATAHQTNGRGTPQANLRLARGLGTVPQKLRLARGPGPPSSESTPRSRARRPLGRDSASLEVASDPRRRTYSPDQSIKCTGTAWVLGSKANPRHAGPLTPPGNHIPAMFHQPTLCGHPRRCAGVVREGRCQLHDMVPPTPAPPPHRTPQKRTVGPSKGIWPPTPHPPRTALRC
jgi:hypothetical protein